ncbi:substrate-binding periplasmic protein [Vibrio paucivorans]|uniref:Transporter substrate-binding domain-containing protein n=1 Tax=Vibrio paucivorans TaxID=2829489 RepID=A0A9X3HRP2_9VIBR|nr:transporter substrate-binding domain-containing protein [Vibrio paucivorans]MCW8334089.1 transporter substrate-binding domain-containing protein [Vibrio paucivorans]
MMKRVASLCAISSLLFAHNAYAQGCRILKVGGANGWLPVTYTDQQTQQPIGIANDFIRFVGQELDIPVQIDISLPWKRTLAYVQSGQLDLVSALYWTEQRNITYRYTAPYYTNEARLFVLKGNEFQFEKFEDLIGRTGMIPLGGSFGEEFDTFAKQQNLPLQLGKDKEQSIKMLIAKRVDYFIQDYVDGTLFLKQQGLLHKVVALPTPVSTTDVYFGMSRESPCTNYIPQINQIIEKAKKDGTLQGIVDGYLQ